MARMEWTEEALLEALGEMEDEVYRDPQGEFTPSEAEELRTELGDLADDLSSDATAAVDPGLRDKLRYRIEELLEEVEYRSPDPASADTSAERVEKTDDPTVSDVEESDLSSESDVEDDPNGEEEEEEEEPIGDPAVTDTEGADGSVAPRAVGRQFDGYGVSDRPTVEDTLGFGDYVDVLETFLVDERTRAPMTIAVEGEWGSGKSSLMRMLQARLDEKRSTSLVERLKARLVGTGGGEEFDSRRDEGGSVVTVWFNPWRHDHEEALWAAFMQTFFRQLTRQLTPYQRFRGHLRWYRGSGRWVKPLVAIVASLVVLGSAVVAWFNPGAVATAFPVDVPILDGPITLLFPVVGSFDVELWRFLVVAAVVSYVLGAVRYLWEPLTHPVEQALGAFASDPEYENRVPFIERFHEDFGDVLSAYVGEGTVFVFVDDLDRCALPRAADLMEAINLLTDSHPREPVPGPFSRLRAGVSSRARPAGDGSPVGGGDSAAVGGDGRRVVTDGAGPVTVTTGNGTGSRGRSGDDGDAPESARVVAGRDEDDDRSRTAGPEVFFVLGMDRQKVAAGIAAKHEELLEHLGTGGAQFGNAYLEKFVQLRVRPPRAGRTELDEFLRKFNEPVPSKTGYGRADEPAREDEGPSQTDELRREVGSAGGERAGRAEPGDAGPEETSESDRLEPLDRLEEAVRHAASRIDSDGVPVSDIVARIRIEVDSNPEQATKVEEWITEQIDRIDEVTEDTVAEQVGGVEERAEVSGVKGEAEVGEKGREGEEAAGPTKLERVLGQFLDDRLSAKELESVVAMVAPFLEYNPRQLTTFVNQFRLEVMLSARRGWFDWEVFRDHPGTGDRTKHQVGKWVAIGMERPELVSKFRANPALVTRLSTDEPQPGSADERLGELIVAEAEEDEYDETWTRFTEQIVRDLLALDPTIAGVEMAVAESGGRRRTRPRTTPDRTSPRRRPGGPRRRRRRA